MIGTVQHVATMQLVAAERVVCVAYLLVLLTVKMSVETLNEKGNKNL